MIGERMSESERTPGGAGRQAPPELWTIGHSTLPIETLVERLETHGIRQVADVRRYPASQRNPQYNRETLATFLEARGMAYRWFEGLGGRRTGVRVGNSPNRGLEVAGFRHYADYAGTEPFRVALAELVEWARATPTAILCAEVLWWRCHRRLIVDRLVAMGGQANHILADGSTELHRLWDLARPAGDGLVYPPEQGELL